MLDYKIRIQHLANIVDIELTDAQLIEVNERVNARIEDGVFESDALDYAFFYIKRNFTKNEVDIRSPRW